MGTRSGRRTNAGGCSHLFLLLRPAHRTHVCFVIVSGRIAHCRGWSLLALLCICHLYVLLFGTCDGDDGVTTKSVHQDVCRQSQTIFSCIFIHCTVPMILGISAAVGYFVIYDNSRFELVRKQIACCCVHQEECRNSQSSFLLVLVQIFCNDSPIT